MIDFSANWFTRVFTNVQLRTLLILPFVLQTVGVVTLVGYLSNANKTILLCALALIIAIGTGSVTAYWISKPILQLSQASQAVAEGQWQKPLSEDIKIAELKILATSFNQMSAQLQKSFRESETKFSTIFHTNPDPVWIATLAEGKCLNVNESFCQWWGDTLENIIGKTCRELGFWENPENWQDFKQILINEGIIQNFQVVICNSSHQNKTVLLSARVAKLDGQDCVIGVIRDISDLDEELRLRKQIEQNLIESENRFRSLFENSPIAYQSLDEQGCFIDVNSQLCELLGYTEAELIGKCFSEVWSQKTQAYFPEAFAYLKYHKYASAELCLMRKDNSEIFVMLEGRVQSEPDGKFVRTHCVLYDITERKYMEEALKDSQNLLQTLASNIPGTIYTLVQHSDQAISFEYVSLGCRYLLELEPEAILENPNLYFQQIHPDDRAGYDAAAALSAKNLEPFFYEWRIITPSGKQKWVTANSSPELRKNGELFWHGVLLDISNRKQAEEALLQSQKFIQQITELTPNLLYIYDHIEQHNVYINRCVGELLGYSAEEIQAMGSNLFPTICYPDDLSLIYQKQQELYSLPDYEFVETEYRVQDAQGQWRWLYSRDMVFSRTTDGKIKQSLGTSQDITDRKQVELELRKSRDLREAIYNESTDAIFLVDVPNPLILDCNNRAVEMFEVASKEEFIGTEGQNLQKQRFTEQQMVMIAEDIAKLGFWSQEIEYVTKKGRHFWGNLAVKRIDIAGQVIDLVRVTDITKRKQAELALRENERRLQEISASSPGVIYITVRRLDGSWDYEYMSRAFEDIHEITVEQVLENPNLCFDQFHPDDCAGYLEAVAYSMKTMSAFNYEWRIITPSGKMKWIKARSRPELRENGEIAYYGVVLDVTDRKQAEIALQEAEANLRKANYELEQLVNTDGLTKIANRRCFDNHLEKEWQRLYQLQQPLSLLLFDVDYFKKYNDFYGHILGDECLIKIAQAVRQTVCLQVDLVARYGGEEFVVILLNTDVEGAMIIANKIHAAIKDLAIPHQSSEVSDIVTISLGISSMIPILELSPATIIEQADQALYQAKQQGRNQSVIFSNYSRLQINDVQNLN